MDSDQHGISLRDLVSFVLGEADAVAAAEIEVAKRENPAVAEDLRHIESMLGTLKQGVFEPVPIALKNAARELWNRAPAPTLSQWLEGVLETTLSVVFDSRRTPEIAGFRGEIGGRHMTYTCDDVEVDVLVEKDGDTCTLRGQITGAIADRVAAIADSGQVLESAYVDQDGAFSLALSPQARDLSIRSSAGALRLCGVQ